MSRFRLQIVDTTNAKVCEWEPGRAVEIDFVQDCITKIVSKGVGLGRTSAHVAKDIEDGINEAIFNLKAKVKPKH